MLEMMFLDLPTIIAHNASDPNILHPSEGGAEPMAPKPATFTIGKGAFNWQAILGFSASVSETNKLPYTKVFLVSGPVIEIAMSYEKFHKQFTEMIKKMMEQSMNKTGIVLPGQMPPGGM